MILVVDAAANASKTFGDKVIWGVKDKNGVWYDFHGGFRPSRGQSLNVKMWAVNGKNGKEYMHCDLIEPPPAQQAAQQAPPPRLAPTTHPDAPSANGTPGASYADYKKAEAEAGMAPKAKIKWATWYEMARAAHELALSMEIGNENAYARMKFVNTTLMEYAKGNLELPTEAGPLSREPGDDGDAYANPDATIPWGKQ